MCKAPSLAQKKEKLVHFPGQCHYTNSNVMLSGGRKQLKELQYHVQSPWKGDGGQHKDMVDFPALQQSSATRL